MMKYIHHTSLLLLLVSIMTCVSAQVEAEPLNKTAPLPNKISLIPAITYPVDAGIKAVDGIALNLLVGHHESMEGVELGLFVNTESGTVRGVQLAGFANVVKEEVVGFQGSGFMNINRNDVKAIQYAGFMNVNEGDLEGIQGSGFMNINEGSMTGLQLAGFMNVNGGDKGKGAQLSGFGNISAGKSHLQASGFVNVADTVEGAQIAGFINVAGRVKGLQIGIINVCDSLEEGMPIGLLNIIGNKDKRYIKFELSTDEVDYGKLAFKIGHPRMYTIFQVGKPKDGGNQRWTMGAGLGTHLVYGKPFTWNIEAVAEQELWVNHEDHAPLYVDRLNMRNQLRSTVGLRLLGFNAFVGPTFNVAVANHEDHRGDHLGEMLTPDWNIRAYDDFDGWDNDYGTRVKMWVGFHAGVNL